MDKINRLMSQIDDNTARIESIDRSLRALITAKTSMCVATGVAVGGTETSFGNVDSTQPFIVIAYFDGGSCQLRIDDRAIGEGASPIVAHADGSGELKLSAVRGNARVAVFGAKLL